jgi:hypothetical protein
VDRKLSTSGYTYLGIPGYLFPIHSLQDAFEPRQPPALSGLRQIEDGPMLNPSEYEPTPTPLSFVAADDGRMPAYDQPSSLPVAGMAMYYNAGVIQEVVSNRLAMGHISVCNECIGYVALLRAGDLNRRVWLQWDDGSVEGPFLVVDVPAAQHIAHLLARNWVVDVDNGTAVRRGIAGPVWVTVLAAPPEESELFKHTMD